MNLLQDRVALITGGARGFGRAIALALATEGADVAVSDIARPNTTDTYYEMADPTDLFAFDELTRILRREIQTAVVNDGLLMQTIDRVYRRTEEISGLAKELDRDMGEYIDFGSLSAGLGAEVKRARDLGSYSLEEKLGQGGMGEVWRARHRMLARPAAIKLIRPSFAGRNGVSTEAVRRFEREAQVIARLRSPHTVNLFDFGVAADGAFYYAMELLDGLDADRLIRRFGPMPAERVVYLLRQICHSLSEAQSCGLVHRDIKPANIFLCRYGEEYDFVKVLDFGIVGTVRTHAPAPVAGLCRHDTHLERAAAIPETVHAALESRPLEVDPAFDLDIRVRVRLRGREVDLLNLPDMNLARLQACLRGRTDTEQQYDGNEYRE